MWTNRNFNNFTNSLRISFILIIFTSLYQFLLDYTHTISLMFSLTTEFALPKYSWVWGLIWLVFDLPRALPIKSTNFSSPEPVSCQ